MADQLKAAELALAAVNTAGRSDVPGLQALWAAQHRGTLSACQQHLDSLRHALPVAPEFETQRGALSEMQSRLTEAQAALPAVDQALAIAQGELVLPQGWTDSLRPLKQTDWQSTVSALSQNEAGFQQAAALAAAPGGAALLHQVLAPEGATAAHKPAEVQALRVLLAAQARLRQLDEGDPDQPLMAGAVLAATRVLSRGGTLLSPDERMAFEAVRQGYLSKAPGSPYDRMNQRLKKYLGAWMDRANAASALLARKTPVNKAALGRLGKVAGQVGLKPPAAVNGALTAGSLSAALRETLRHIEPGDTIELSAARGGRLASDSLGVLARVGSGTVGLVVAPSGGVNAARQASLAVGADTSGPFVLLGSQGSTGWEAATRVGVGVDLGSRQTGGARLFAGVAVGGRSDRSRAQDGEALELRVRPADFGKDRLQAADYLHGALEALGQLQPDADDPLGHLLARFPRLSLSSRRADSRSAGGSAALVGEAAATGAGLSGGLGVGGGVDQRVTQFTTRFEAGTLQREKRSWRIELTGKLSASVGLKAGVQRAEDSVGSDTLSATVAGASVEATPLVRLSAAELDTFRSDGQVIEAYQHTILATVDDMEKAMQPELRGWLEASKERLRSARPGASEDAIEQEAWTALRRFFDQARDLQRQSQNFVIRLTRNLGPDALQQLQQLELQAHLAQHDGRADEAAVLQAQREALLNEPAAWRCFRMRLQDTANDRQSRRVGWDLQWTADSGVAATKRVLVYPPVPEPTVPATETPAASPASSAAAAPRLPELALGADFDDWARELLDPRAVPHTAGSR